MFLKRFVLCSKTLEMREKTAKAYNARFCYLLIYLLGILKLAWHLKTRSPNTFLRADLSRDWFPKFATGLKYVTKTEHLFNKWPICCSKIDMLRFLGIENLHKKFGVDISKIMDFFLMCNFWWSFLCFWKSIKKREMTTKSYTLGKNT